MSLVLIALLIISWGVAYYASLDSLALANDINLYRQILSTSGLQYANEFKDGNIQNAKYFEIISNFSLINVIMFGIFSLFIPKRDELERGN